MRKKTRQVNVGGVLVGGGAPVAVQSMVKAPVEDAAATLDRIKTLAECGCEIIRVAVPSVASLESFASVAARSPLPVVADVHFDWRIAEGALEAGAAKVRLNPGNMKPDERMKRFARNAVEKRIPVRLGVNSGSVMHQAAPEERGTDVVGRMVQLLEEWVREFEEAGLKDIVLSAKCSDVRKTVEAYRRLNDAFDCPLHVGVTAAGPPALAAAKSAVGIGSLLLDGIGDTIRVSYTGPEEEEVAAAWAILESLDLRSRGPELISCPTCGRTHVNLRRIVDHVWKELDKRNYFSSTAAPTGGRRLRIAVMGCPVNGPGEAAEADIGLACDRDGGVLFARGKKIRRVGQAEMLDALLAEIERVKAERE